MTRYLPEGQRKLDYDWDGILKDSCAVQSLIRSEEILEAKAV